MRQRMKLLRKRRERMAEETSVVKTTLLAAKAEKHDERNEYVSSSMTNELSGVSLTLIIVVCNSGYPILNNAQNLRANRSIKLDRQDDLITSYFI